MTTNAHRPLHALIAVHRAGRDLALISLNSRRSRSGPDRSACRSVVAYLAILMTWLISPGVTRAEAPDDFDRWYSLELQGRRAGWAHSTQVTTDRLITTTTRQELRLRRGDDVLELSAESSFVESVTGEAISMRLTQSLGAAPVTHEFVYAPTSIDAKTILGLGRDPKHETIQLAVDGNVPAWLTPAAGAAYVRQRLAAGATEIVFRSPIVDRSPIPVVQTLRVRGPAESRVIDKPVKGYDLVATVGPPGQSNDESIRLVDERGVVMLAETVIGGLRLRATLVDQEAALAAFEPADATEAMLVRATSPMSRPRERTRAEYVVSIATGKTWATTLPSAASQIAEAGEDGRVRVRIDTTGSAHPAPAEDSSDARYTDPSILIDSADANIMRLSRKSVNGIGERPAAEQAEAMRKFVHGYIKNQGLSIGVASASEVAMSKSGDCTEHAVLLAAMLRAGGIPSRVVTGLVYVESFGTHQGVFVYHMWTQALVALDDDAGTFTWIDLDATLDGERSMDAAHIALQHTPLDDATALAPIEATLARMNGLKIDIVRVE